MPLAAKLTGVDNARESVEADGRILGILESETMTARMDRGIDQLEKKYARFGDFLGFMKGAVLKKAETEISYEPGAEMEISLIKALEVGCKPAVYDVEPIAPFIGSREQVEAVFAAAGWSTAEALNATSDKIETDGKMAVLLL